jgi:hypothetical protein
MMHLIDLVKDFDIKGKEDDRCRIALYGITKSVVSPENLDRVKVYNWWSKFGLVEQIIHVKDGLVFEIIGSGLASHGGISAFIGLKVRTQSGYVGQIFASYGTDGHFKVRFENGARGVSIHTRISLRCKRYLSGNKKILVQGEEYDMPVALDNVHHTDVNRADVIPVESYHPATSTRLNGTAKETVRAGIGKSRIVTDEAGASTLFKGLSSNTCVEKLSMASDVSMASESGPCGRRGIVESVKGDVVIVDGMFAMEDNIKHFVGASCRGSAGEVGEIMGPFAKLGKCKVSFRHGFNSGLGSIIEML